MVGAYTKFRPLEEADRKVFEEAKRGLISVEYEPLIVATQVVAGTNYKFICNATAMLNPPREYAAEVTIFQPLPGEGKQPVITDISEIK